MSTPAKYPLPLLGDLRLLPHRGAAPLGDDCQGPGGRCLDVESCENRPG
jgi:hypothetical protein